MVAHSNQSGSILRRYHYAPYGESLAAPLGTPMDDLGYTGHDMDADTGLTYMQQRYYDPVIGRFLSNDPVGMDAGSGGNFNRYWYANNNPYRFVDPDGRQACDSNGPQDCSSRPNPFERPGAWRPSWDLDESNNKYSHPAVRAMVPGAVSSDNMVNSAVDGNYGDALLWGVAAAGEQVAFVFTLGFSMEVRAGLSVAEVATASASRGAGLLAQSEAAGGHLIARHVGKTTDQLAARLAGNARLSAASTFNSVAQAEGAIASALQANASQVSTWVAAGAQGRLVINAPFSGGSVLVRAASVPVPGTGVRAVLQGNASGGYHVVTGFPVP